MGCGTHTEWTAATFHNAKFGARSGATPQDAQERRDAFPFPFLSSWQIERQTHAPIIHAPYWPTAFAPIWTG